MNTVLYILYALVWTFLVPVLSMLALFFVAKWKKGLKQKLGFLPEIKNKNPIWFHAVSVGELNALIPLLSHFKGMSIVLSTGTETAQEMAKIKLKEQIEKSEIELIYLPWDHPFLMSKSLEHINPSSVILMETEIWPSLVVEASRRNVPVSIINARISDSSFRSYKIFKPFLSGVFSKLSLVLAQSPSDSRKFIDLGVTKDIVYMTGNIKFAPFRKVFEQDHELMRSKLGYSNNDLIFIAASTHPEEEVVIINIFQELKELFPQLRLIIAPRHKERFYVVEDLILSAAKLETLRYSNIKECLANKNDHYQKISNYNEVLLVDTIGDLTNMFAIADIAFVGGTINEKVGGHNVLEPAVYGVPVCIGPYFKKNRDTVALMDNADALMIADNPQDLKFAVKDLVENKDRRILMGANAVNLIKKNKNIISDTANKLKENLLSV